MMTTSRRQGSSHACCTDGIFYLDMSGTQPEVQNAVDDIFTLEKELFNLLEEELMNYDIDKLSPRKLSGFALSQRLFASIVAH